MKSTRKFSVGKDYQAKYRFPSKFNEDGEIIGTTLLTTTISGLSIIKAGLKQTIRKEAKRLGIPQGYICDVQTNDDIS